jgi:hypothetical protein
MKRQFVLFTALVIAFRAAVVFAQDPALAQAAVDRIRMTIADKLEEVAGSLDVQYMNSGRDPLGSVVFFLFPNLTPGSLDILEVRVGGRRVLPEYRQKRSVLVVPLPTPLGSGEKVTIGLDYTVSVPARPVRRFPGQRREPLLRPGFCPSRVRDCRPGTVTRRKAPGGRTDVSISLAPARDLSMAISKDWVRTERGQNGVTVASYMARDAEDSSRQVLSIALAALDCFGRRFGPYPLDALTFVSLPFDAYGCEFSGIVLVSARLHDPSFRVDHRPRGRPPMVLRDRGQRPAPGAVAEGTRRRSTAPSCRAGLRSSLR